MAADQTQIQLGLLLGPDPGHFETLISNLMSSSNEQRSHAESLLSLIRQSHPDALALNLARTLTSSALPECRAMAAILLRKHLTRDDSSSFIYTRLTPSTQNNLKSVLLLQLQKEGDKSILKKLCDAVSELSASVLPDGAWPELLPFVFQCLVTFNTKIQESALLILSRLSQFVGEVLITHIDTLHEVFSRFLGNENVDLRIAALEATVNFIMNCLPGLGDKEKFQDLLPLMMRTLTEALNKGNELSAQEALELLIELAATEPRFLRKQLVDVVGSMLQVAEAEGLEEGTRHLAIEFVVSLAEARERAPGMIRKLPEFIRRLFLVLMNMLLDLEDDPLWHSAENEDEDAGETSNYGFGQECLDRLAISLGGNTILPVASEVFPGFLAAPEWQKHHAVLIALAQIAEGCSKVINISSSNCCGLFVFIHAN